MKNSYLCLFVDAVLAFLIVDASVENPLFRPQAFKSQLTGPSDVKLTIPSEFESKKLLNHGKIVTAKEIDSEPKLQQTTPAPIPEEINRPKANQSIDGIISNEQEKSNINGNKKTDADITAQGKKASEDKQPSENTQKIRYVGNQFKKFPEGLSPSELKMVQSSSRSKRGNGNVKSQADSEEQKTNNKEAKRDKRNADPQGCGGPYCRHKRNADPQAQCGGPYCRHKRDADPQGCGGPYCRHKRNADPQAQCGGPYCRHKRNADPEPLCVGEIYRRNKRDAARKRTTKCGGPNCPKTKKKMG